MAAEISQNLFYWLTGLPVAVLILYGAIIVYFNKKPHRDSAKIVPSQVMVRTTFEPFVSVVVATHNEEKIICKENR